MLQNIIADNNGCKLNVDYEPPENYPVRVETYAASTTTTTTTTNNNNNNNNNT